MRILLTNDDGIAAPGLRCLLAAAQQLGEVKIFAPDRERSACAHAMTLRDPLRVMPTEGLPVEAWAVSGFPVNCVNIGLSIGWPGGCDLVISGVNAGPNLGIDTTYSGTVGGAMEGTINGVSSVAVSLASFVTLAPLDWSSATRWLSERLADLVAVELPPRTFLNVNIPSVAYEEIRGIRVCRVGERVYEERIECRNDPWGRPYYWQGGAVVMTGDQPGTDVEALAANFVAVSPITLDWTEYKVLAEVGKSLNASASP